MELVRLPVAATFAITLAAAPPTFLTGCASEETTNNITVGGIDYAFDAPSTLPPGPTAIAFENRGQVPHEMILVRLKEGMTLDQLMEGTEAGGNPRDFTEGGPGILIAEPGQTAASRLLVDLLPGRSYVLICNFQDEPDAPSHMALGMRSSFQVASTTD
jgi:hypothetical protein